MTARVVVLTTGGTIGHRTRDGIAVLNFDPGELAADLQLPGIDLELRPVFAKGSMEIVPDDWRTLATAAAEAISSAPRGLVVLHGTDTLHYSAAALSFMLRDPGLPLVLTGSMLPGGDPGSDALPNLRDAIRVAAAADLGEVCVVFSADAARSKGLIIRGVRARKIHSFAIDAFASINAPAIGWVQDASVVIRDPRARRAPTTPRLSAALEQNVVLLKLNPAVTPEILARQLDGAAGAVLEGTGIGHVRRELQPVVAAFNGPVVMTTQAAHGGERLGLYDADKAILDIPNLIPAGGMTSEAALVKLMWALAQGGDVRTIMRTDIAGELTGASGA